MRNGMTVHHCVSKWVFDVKQYYRNIKNNNLVCDKKNMIHLPLELRLLLQRKHKEFDCFLIEFTVGYMDISDIRTWAIAIVHKKDSFNRKIGFEIVKGRLEKAVGLRQDKYDEYPTTVVTTRCQDW
jgi:hypothetical protein